MALLRDPVMGDDPPNDRPACECDYRLAKRKVSDAIDDALYEHHLEWNASDEMATRLLEDYLRSVTMAVRDCEGDCR